MMKKLAIVGTAALLPLFALAQVENIGLGGFLLVINRILNTLVPIIVGIAFIVFLWGVVQYILAGGDEEKRTESRQFIIYGVIGMFVMVAAWGLVRILIQTFDLNVEATDVPGVPLQPGQANPEGLTERND